MSGNLQNVDPWNHSLQQRTCWKVNFEKSSTLKIKYIYGWLHGVVMAVLITAKAYVLETMNMLKSKVLLL